MNIFEGSRRVAKLTAAGIAIGFLIAFAYDNPEPVSISYLITDGKTPPTRVDECQSSAQSARNDFVAKSGISVIIKLCLPEFQKNVEVPVVGGSKVNKVKAPDGAVPELKGSIDIYDQINALINALTKTQLYEVNVGGVTYDVDAPDEATAWRWANIEHNKPKAQQRTSQPPNPYDLIDPPARSIPHALSRLLKVFKIPESDESYITRLGWLNTAKSAGMHLLGMLASIAAFWAFTWAVGWIVRGFMGITRGKDSKE